MIPFIEGVIPFDEGVVPDNEEAIPVKVGDILVIKGIIPVSGYFGPKTRNAVNADMGVK